VLGQIQRQTLRQLLGFYLLCHVVVLAVAVVVVVVSSLLAAVAWLISWVSFAFEV